MRRTGCTPAVQDLLRRLASEFESQGAEVQDLQQENARLRRLLLTNSRGPTPLFAHQEEETATEGVPDFLADLFGGAATAAAAAAVVGLSVGTGPSSRALRPLARSPQSMPSAALPWTHTEEGSAESGGPAVDALQLPLNLPSKRGQPPQPSSLCSQAGDDLASLASLGSFATPRAPLTAAAPRPHPPHPPHPSRGGQPPQPKAQAGINFKEPEDEDLNLAELPSNATKGDSESRDLRRGTTKKMTQTKLSQAILAPVAAAPVAVRVKLPQRLEKIRADFEDLVTGRGKGLSASQVLDIRHELDARDESDSEEHTEDLQRFQTAITEFNSNFGVLLGTGDPCPDVTSDTYALLVDDAESRVRIVDRIADEEIVATLRDLRRILIGLVNRRNIEKQLNQKVAEQEDTSCFQRLVYRLDPVMGIVVLANGIIIGIRCDNFKDWEGWLWIELGLVVVYVLEILLKLAAFGCRRILIGPDWRWNWFDILVVAAAAVEIGYSLEPVVLKTSAAPSSSTRFVSIIRLLRFARFARLLKVLRLRMFKDITLLINGLVVGLQTLFWVMVCLVYLVYMLAVVLTQTLGLDTEDAKICEDPAGHGCTPEAHAFEQSRLDLFGTIPRSMFTIFRCYTEGCSSSSGYPMGPLLYANFGAALVVPYVLISIIVIFGIFNLIAAIFVENTIQGAKAQEEIRREAAEAWQELGQNLQKVMAVFVESPDADKERVDQLKKQPRLFQWFARWFSSKPEPVQGKNVEATAEITQAMFERALLRPDVQTILDELEVPSRNRKTLFEVLDADGSGCLEVSELVKGLLKLRSGGGESDVVALLLAVQSLRKSQQQVQEFCMVHDQTIGHLLAKSEKLEEHMVQLVERLEADLGLAPPPAY